MGFAINPKTKQVEEAVSVSSAEQRNRVQQTESAIEHYKNLLEQQKRDLETILKLEG